MESDDKKTFIDTMVTWFKKPLAWVASVFSFVLATFALVLYSRDKREREIREVADQADARIDEIVATAARDRQEKESNIISDHTLQRQEVLDEYEKRKAELDSKTRARIEEVIAKDDSPTITSELASILGLRNGDLND